MPSTAVIAPSWFEPMPRPVRRHRDTALGKLIREAMDRKALELSRLHGRPVNYTYRDLAADAHIQFSTVGTWIHGQVRPGPDTLQAVIRALRPHLDPNETMAAAGYMPPSSNLQRLLRRAMRLPTERVADALAAIETASFGRPMPALPEDRDELYEWPEEKHSRRKRRNAASEAAEDAARDDGNGDSQRIDPAIG